MNFPLGTAASLPMGAAFLNKRLEWDGECHIPFCRLLPIGVIVRCHVFRGVVTDGLCPAAMPRLTASTCLFNAIIILCPSSQKLEGLYKPEWMTPHHQEVWRNRSQSSAVTRQRLCTENTAELRGVPAIYLFQCFASTSRPGRRRKYHCYVCVISVKYSYHASVYGLGHFFLWEWKEIVFLWPLTSISMVIPDRAVTQGCPGQI